MIEYNKIDTIFERDTKGTKKLLEGVYRSQTVEYLKELPWEVTEKVDGTNIRVHWDGHKVEFGGRTDRAQITAGLVNRLNELFGGEVNAQIFEQTFGEREVYLFGEGYGEKIQNGGDYISGRNPVEFILFDVMISGNYQPRETVEGIASIFGIQSVPVVMCCTLPYAVEYIKTHPMSLLGNGRHEMEGVVCRPMEELKDRCGNRVIVKIKWADFKNLNNC